MSTISTNKTNSMTDIHPYPMNNKHSRKNQTRKFVRKLIAQRYIQVMALLGGIIIAFKQF